MLALALQIVVVTDATWKGSAEPASGWETAAFDDSAWEAAADDSALNRYEEYCPGNMFAFPSRARWISAGDGGCLRKTISVPKDYRRAEAVLAADNAGEVYVNGTVAFSYDTDGGAWGHRGGAMVVDLAPFLEAGDNVIAVRVVNRGGPTGFVMEVRIDGDPLAPSVKVDPLRADEATAIRALVKTLSSDDFDEREKATEELRRLARRPAACDLLKELRASADVEAQVRIDVALGQSELAFPPVEPAGLEKLLTAVPANRMIRRDLALAADLARRDRPAFDKAMRAVRDFGPPGMASFVRLAGLLEIDVAADLAAELEKHPKTVVAAWAASALGRLGAKDHVKALEAAASCGYAPTERAAKHALRLLK